MTDNLSSDHVPPSAASTIESMRAFEYDLGVALSDIVDNSISANAKTVDITCHWSGARSWFSIVDDGDGMALSELRPAMRFGSRSPTEERKRKELGRFGLGLKTASISVCRRLTVITRSRGSDCVARCWDLDHVVRTDSWELLPGSGEVYSRYLADLAAKKHGTVVLWENLDRLVQDSDTHNRMDHAAFLLKIEEATQHLGMVFHRFIERGEIALCVNGTRVAPWDPFLAKHQATQHLPEERWQYRGETVQVQPFVLPHRSKLDSQSHQSAAGGRGWNEQQGFYVYREQRLIVAGSWLGLWRKEEHCKLARIRVDIPNCFDLEWGIGVTKTRVRPPDVFRQLLQRVGAAAREKAIEVYRFRGRRAVPVVGKEIIFLWEPVKVHDQNTYRVNHDHPLVKQAFASCSEKAALRSLLRLMEETLPFPHITITNNQFPDSFPMPFEHEADKSLYELMKKTLSLYCAAFSSNAEALECLRYTHPFHLRPDLIETLIDSLED